MTFFLFLLKAKNVDTKWNAYFRRFYRVLIIYVSEQKKRIAYLVYPKNSSKYGQETPQSHAADQPMAPQERATEHSQ